CCSAVALLDALPISSGARTFKTHWGVLFMDKEVWIVYDNDDSGKNGAAKARGIIAKFAAAVHIVNIPLAKVGADSTDYLHESGHSAEDYVTMLQTAADGAKVKKETPLLLTGKEVSLQESMAEENQRKALELVVTVAGKQQEPYTAPKRIEATCDMSKGQVCAACPMSSFNGTLSLELRQDNEQLFRFVD